MNDLYESYKIFKSYIDYYLLSNITFTLFITFLILKYCYYRISIFSKFIKIIFNFNKDMLILFLRIKNTNNKYFN